MIQRVDKLDEVARCLAEETWDLVICDYRLEDFTALAVLRLLQNSKLDLPFIVVSGAIGEDRLIGLMKAGAHDIILKDRLERLVPAIERELEQAGIRQERRVARRRLEYLARYDPLSGLPNRALFQDRLAQALLRAKRSRSSIALMYIDLDRFKLVNDRFGHAAGDQLLKSVAKRLSSALRETDTAARFGGDEFVVLVERLEDASAAERVARKLLDAFVPAFELDGNSLSVTPSIGIAIHPENGEDIDTLIKNADTAMYCSKRMGRNTFQVYDPELPDDLERREDEEASLREQLEEEYYIVDGAAINDLNNMLVPILNLTKASMESEAADDEERMRLEKLFMAGQRMRRLIKFISEGTAGESLGQTPSKDPKSVAAIYQGRANA